MKSTTIFLFLQFIAFQFFGQVSINTTAAPPAASSMLDVSSTTSGILIPRMTTAQRDAISSPVTSLMIFNTTTGAYNYWNGSAWIAIAAGNIKSLSDADNDTKVEVEKNANEDKIRFTAGNFEIGILDNKCFQLKSPGQSVFIGENAGLNDDGSSNQNVFVGNGAGKGNTTGGANTFVGTFAGEFNSEGTGNAFFGKESGKLNLASNNTFIGSEAGKMNVSGTGNTFVGQGAGDANTASDNTFIGKDAGGVNISGAANTFVGQGAGDSNVASDNTFIGKDAGGANVTGTANTFLGKGAGFSSTASNNTFIGKDAGAGNLGGTANTFVGQGAGDVNTASNNTFIGKDAGGANTSGTFNTFIGKDAGLSNTAGGSNTFVGQGAGDVSTGADNTFIGKDAGGANIGGPANAFFGVNAGNTNVSGQQITCIGKDSDVSTASLVNATAIGANAIVSGSNCLVLGNGANVGIGISNPGFQFQLSTNGAAKPTANTWTVISDLRLKKDIHDFEDGLDALLKIHPVWFTYTGEAGMPNETGVGVIAQELQKTSPYMVSTWNYEDENQNSTSYLSVNNGAMTYMLINAVKEQQEIISQQQRTIADSNAAVHIQQEQIDLLFIELNQLKQKLNNGN